MPLYMDIHELGEVSAEDVAKAHVADLEAQEKYGVNYLKYWVNENCGKVFCLVEAPNAEAANSCHRDALSALGGREVKHTGDGIMASFVSAAGAVRCAIQIQRELAKQEKANPERPLKVRVGAAAGEPVEQHNDLFGSTVQLAARLCAHAQPEQILVSNAIAELCIGKGLSFEDVGEVRLKGFGSPVRAHAAAWKHAN